ncbi:MAG: ATP-binding protein [Gemmatimonadota bacterium]
MSMSSAKIDISAETRSEDVFVGGGDAGELLKKLDWRGCSLGAPREWPQSLRTALSICLASRHPICILWGPEYTYLYNDAYAPIVGSKHPAALGAPYPEVWPEVWEGDIKPVLQPVMATGVASWADNLLLVLHRFGFNEECYFSFSFAPIRDESGQVGGVFTAITETTPQVVGQRRLKTLSDLGARTSDAKSVDQACSAAVQVLSENPHEVPFALVYLLEPDGGRAVLSQHVGIPPDRAPPPACIEITAGDDGDTWGFSRALSSGVPVRLSPLPPAVADLAGAPWTDPVTNVVVLPLGRSGQPGLHGFLVCGVSPRRPLDADYQNFLALVARQVTTTIGSALAYEDERKRAEALAELDRAKTTFFSNVSHEFRTPLTLMLGMLQDALEDTEESLAPAHRTRLEVAHRNSLRLLKLVNTLLDFARIEAGRVHAAYEATDLAAATIDLASCFRSAVEKAGLRLIVDCAPLPEAIYVDREMWEKVVLNLLSNAFKYTLQGEIEVRLTAHESDVRLEVRDTGIGIAEDQLPHIFERFYRADGVHARTHEGTGIGLALVEELVKLHGGTVEVMSSEGLGATFIVTIPRGATHLSADRIGAVRTLAPTALRAETFVEEALGWLPDDAATITAHNGLAGGARIVRLTQEPAVRLVVVDDNADMREYLRHLLGDRYAVEAVANATQALDAIRRSKPALLLSDVMMPGVDGFQLLSALRADPLTSDLPVVLLSARAGEESRIEALAAGADDYLVKPFSARELRSRVEHHVLRGRMRAAEHAHTRQLARIFEHAPVGIAVLRGESHVFEFVNGPYIELVGQRPLIGLSVRAALPELENQGIYELLDRVFQTGVAYVGRSVRLDVVRGEAQTLQECYFDFVYQPMPNDAGGIDTIVVIAFEVTQLARTQRAAEAASRSKDEFLAMLGHELRNPLAPIVTALQLMRLRGVSEGESERGIIERQVQHLASLVDDLLDVSRLTRGKVELRKERVTLADLVARAVEQARPLLEQQNHTVSIRVEGDALPVDADPRRMAQVISNLLTNAAKYTEPGGRIWVEGEAQGNEAVLRVRDNGIGIEADMLPLIFDLFYQENQSAERSRGGLGLGLTIVRHFVELHGGRVSAASEGLGCGTEITVHLPLAEGPGVDHRPEQQPARTPVLGGARVLIVDDNVDAAEVLAASLRACGHTTRVAHDGPSALAAVESFLPEVGLLDIGLPAMDGYELAQRLRDRPALVNVRLYALTGYGQEEDRRRSRAAGFAGHLIKPMDIGALDRLLRTATSNDPRGDAEDPSSSSS